MRHLKNVLVVALMMLTMCAAVFAQTARRTDDPRNIAPTVGTGGAVGGPTGLFTVYDGQTLRAGEYTFSAAYSNYDRDPGNVDITEVPLSFQVGVNDYLELFFTTDGYRGVKVNSPRNLSGFYLPNNRVVIGGQSVLGPALVLAPTAAGTNVAGGALFRPATVGGVGQPFTQYPFVNGFFVDSLGRLLPIGPFTAGSGNGADRFPGVGSVVGGILPGLVLSTQTFGTGFTVPTVSTLAPSYLPDAPFLSRTWGESAFSTFNVGAKWRFTGPNNPIGIGVIPFVRFYADQPDSLGGFNQLQRGASPGGDRFEGGATFFADARVARWANVSANAGYIFNAPVKAEIGNDEVTLLDRPDEFNVALGVDFPVNRYFQPIGEIRATKYVGGRTPNAFEQDPIDLLAGVRIFPARWVSLGFAYRYNVNQQDEDIFDEDFRVGSQTFTGAPTGFIPSDDPNGFIIQGTIGRRNAREVPQGPNTPGEIRNITISDTEIVVPVCPPGSSPRAGSCNDNTSVTVATDAFDKDGDQLLYQYTVSGGRVNGSGANVTWDLSGAQPGTYTISVGVDDGCGVCGQPVTREVRVVNCTDCVPDQAPCPTGLAVTANPTLVQVDQTVAFTADVNLNGTNPTFNWSVSAGEIVEGQGTPRIVVRATPGTREITATASLGGIDPSCPASASATAQVEEPPTTRQIDDYGRLSNDDIKQRNDQAVITLQEAGADARLFIISYGTPRDVQRRNNFIVRDLTTRRGIDPSRIVTVNGGTSTTGIRTQVYVVPAGAQEPQPAPQE
jgi:hypothetical protein